MLLQTVVDGMSNVTFTLKDVFYICGLLVTILGGFFSLKNQAKNQEKELEDIRSSLVSVKTSRKAMRVEIKEEVEKKEEVLHKRIDVVRDDLKEFRTKTDEEFKSINSGITDLKSTSSRIEGMLSQLINK